MKVLKYSLLCMQFLFIFKSESLAQPSLDTVYVLRTSSIFYKVFPFTGHYALNGLTTDWIFPTGGGVVNQSRSLFATFDLIGNNLDTANFTQIDSNLLLLGTNITSFEGLYCGFKDNNDFLYSVGSQLKVNSLNLQYNTIKIVKTDSIGSLIWDKIFEIGNDSGWGPVESFYNEALHRIFVVGYVFDPYRNFKYPFIAEFDTSGSLINWFRILNLSGRPAMSNITVDAARNYYVSGYELIGSSSGVARTWRISPIGQVIWSYNFSCGINSGAFDVLQSNDGNLVVTYACNIAQNRNLYHLLKVDTSGNTIWDRVYNYTRQTAEVSPLIELQNTNIVNVCMFRDTIGNALVGQALTMFDSSGTKLWERRFFPDSSYVRIQDIAVTPDGGFVMCGSRGNYLDTATSYIVSHAWVLKTDSLGLITSVNNITPSYIANASIRNPYPNPANSEINIEVFVPIEAKKAFLHLFDMSGKELQTIEIVKGISKNNISLQGLSVGNYIVALSVDDYAAGSKRIVKVE